MFYFKRQTTDIISYLQCTFEPEKSFDQDSSFESISICGRHRVRCSRTEFPLAPVSPSHTRSSTHVRCSRFSSRCQRMASTLKSQLSSAMWYLGEGTKCNRWKIKIMPLLKITAIAFLPTEDPFIGLWRHSIEIERRTAFDEWHKLSVSYEALVVVNFDSEHQSEEELVPLV